LLRKGNNGLVEQTLDKAFMLDGDTDDLQSLEHKYLVEELGIAQKDKTEARNNKLGYFATLYKIQKRVEQTEQKTSSNDYTQYD
jgi:hypothetical protein